MDASVLVAGMAALSQAATGDFAVEEMLRSLCTVAAEAVAVDGAGVMIRENGRNRFVHATTDVVAPLERLQELLQDGPCAECMRLGMAVVLPDLGAPDLGVTNLGGVGAVSVDGGQPSPGGIAIEPRAGARMGLWTDYRALSVELGLGAMVAVPLLSRGRGWGVLDLYRRAPGIWTHEELEAAQLLADVAVSYIVMAYDRDSARTAQLTLAHRATHDDLTGLANRALLFDRLEHALAAVGRQHTSVAVVFLDLDLFKDVNDHLGHTAADAVLVEVATRLNGTLRGSDTLARYAGDEFVLVCESLPAEPSQMLSARVEALTRRLLAVFRQPIAVGGTEVVVSASVGVAITSEKVSAQELIGAADTAMYSAKQGGRARVSIHDHQLTGSVVYARQLERDLAHALQRNQLRVHYQPILTAGTREVAAVEALLRWDRPGVPGVLPAVTFIDVAIRSGLITAIGRWVIEETTAQMRQWHRDLGDRSPPTVFVNLSSRELADPTLPAFLATALTANGLRPAEVGVELVEHDLAVPEVIGSLEELNRRGHPLSVDDFGTGFSSLSRLIDLPVDLAKIDRSFVRGVPTDPRRKRLVEAILLMATTLDIGVIAEGVETADQADYLTDAGCDLLQGYHLGRPQPADELTAAWAS